MDDIITHLICHGICPTYTKWIWHGELPKTSSTPPTGPVDEQVGDCIESMLRDPGQEGFRQAQAPYYEKLDTDSKKPLYTGYTKYTRLSRVLALVNLKVRFGWSVSQHALRGRARARLTGVLPKGGKMRGVATNVYSWKTSGKPKETGQNENSKFGSCIYV